MEIENFQLAKNDSDLKFDLSQGLSPKKIESNEKVFIENKIKKENEEKEKEIIDFNFLNNFCPYVNNIDNNYENDYDNEENLILLNKKRRRFPFIKENKDGNYKVN